ncbi:hypothetical protein ACFFGT_19335 [Mucilaginibacter angelicae]|uniref:Uncharacterized protein n=1 Tax=Mucilaginibacter angelicae TaxID=869718 RepID=A0ABV6LA72_9SPHI
MNEEELNDVYRLDEQEVMAVQDGIGQIENGYYLTNREANILINQCLDVTDKK